MRRRITTYRGKRVRNEDNEWEELPSVLWEGSGESPNRILMPRKIGRHRPEEERGYKPTVI